MLIHRGNTLKAHQHISYSVFVAVTLLKEHCSIQRDHLKKTIFIQNLIKIFTKTHQIAHYFKHFS